MNVRFHGQWGDVSCKELYFAACEMRVSRRVYCLPSDADGRFTSQCLLNHHIKNLTTTGVTECGRACWVEPRCHAFNLWQRANNAKKICQLNSESQLEADVSDFQKIVDCAYFKL